MSRCPQVSKAQKNMPASSHSPVFVRETENQQVKSRCPKVRAEARDEALGNRKVRAEARDEALGNSKSQGQGEDQGKGKGKGDPGVAEDSKDELKCDLEALVVFWEATYGTTVTIDEEHKLLLVESFVSIAVDPLSTPGGFCGIMQLCVVCNTGAATNTYKYYIYIHIVSNTYKCACHCG